MKHKHLIVRIEQCLTLSRASNCVRAQYGALLLDAERNVVLMDGYNGGPRGGGELCGGDQCLRDGLGTERVEIGCHHAELNLICNAAANGVRCRGAWLIVSGVPCPLCAKLIHHAGIVRVITVVDSYPDGCTGPVYLQEHGVDVEQYTHEEVREMAKGLRALGGDSG